MTTQHIDRSTGRHLRSRRIVRSAAVALTLGGAGLAIASLAPSAGAADGSRITITKTALPRVEGCLPAAMAVSYSWTSDIPTFHLRLTVNRQLCDPVSATAVVYAMPKDGSQWPQTLSEKMAFTLSEPAVIDVMFTKDCTPSQFDVVTGATPDRISPSGPMHGPLLIPDVNTSFQDPGIACGPATTTTAAPSTTIATTTTAAGVVGVTSTTQPALVGGVSGTATTTTAAQTSVLAESLPRSSTASNPTSSSGTGSQLAVTGVSSQRLANFGGLMVAVGAVLLVATRRRNVPAMQMITSKSSVESSSPFSTR